MQMPWENWSLNLPEIWILFHSSQERSVPILHDRKRHEIFGGIGYHLRLRHREAWHIIEKMFQHFLAESSVSIDCLFGSGDGLLFYQTQRFYGYTDLSIVRYFLNAKNGLIYILEFVILLKIRYPEYSRGLSVRNEAKVLPVRRSRRIRPTEINWNKEKQINKFNVKITRFFSSKKTHQLRLVPQETGRYRWEK